MTIFILFVPSDPLNESWGRAAWLRGADVGQGTGGRGVTPALAVPAGTPGPVTAMLGGVGASAVSQHD